MAKKKIEGNNDATTEEKIKTAARKVFMKKGFAAARTRDIVEEAGINLALLNYYFRSKEKLFDIIMEENLQQLLLEIKKIFNDENTSFQEKINLFAENYIDLLIANPSMPLFVLSEIKLNPEGFENKLSIRTILYNSHFFKQMQQSVHGKINPLHLIMNVISLTVFPFVAGPLLRQVGQVGFDEYIALMEERKKLIPLWVAGMLNSR